MTRRTVITLAFLLSISAMVKAQSTTNTTYRSVGNTRYVVLNPSGETHLYQLESASVKNQSAVAQYFFSRGTGKIQKLTIKNVKIAFAGDAQFQEALDAEFGSDAALNSNESLTRLAALFEIQEESSLLASGSAGQ